MIKMDITNDEQEIIYNLFTDVNIKFGLGKLQIELLNKLRDTTKD